MKILLIQPAMNWRHPWCEAPSTALLLLGTIAQNRGHQVKIVHLDIDVLDIESYRPDIVGITLNTFGVRSAHEVVKAVREVSSQIEVVIGGPHAPEWDGDADEVVVGEGETRWLEILGEKPEDPDMDCVIDYDLVDLHRFTGIGPKVGAVPSMCIMTMRGCPSGCTFCNTPVHWGRKVRYRNPVAIVAEIQKLHDKYGAREVFIQDDTFNINHRWASEVFEGIICLGLNKDMVFRLTGRVDEKLVTKDYLDLAFKAGVWNIFYGIESGSQYMLDRMKKGVTVDEIKRAIRITHEAHITTTCSFIVGLPGESRETLEATGELINEIKPFSHGWGFFCPFPRTEAREEVVKNGHIKDVSYSDYTYGMLIVRTDELDYSDLTSFKGFTRKEAQSAIRN